MHRTLLVAALLLVAGCSALSPDASSPTTTPETPDISVTLVNEATGNQSYTFTYGTVPGRVDAVRETTVDGEPRVVDNLTGDAGANLFHPTDVVAVEPVGEFDVEGEFTLQAGDSVTATIEDSKRITTVFVVDRTDDRVTALGLARCPPPTTTNSADFLVGGYGPLVGLGCAG